MTTSHPTRTRTSTSAPVTTDASGPARRHRRLVLATDAAGCAVIGAGLVAAPGWLADQLGLATTAPLRFTGLVFAVAAVTNLVAARSDRRGPAIAAIELDVAFALVLLASLLAGSSGATPLGRSLVVATAAVSLAFAAAKLLGLPPRSGAAGRHLVTSR